MGDRFTVAFEVSMKVGKYELGRTLGEGTFAKVKFARNSETGETVAVTVLDKEKILKHKMVDQVQLFHNNARYARVYSVV